MIPSIKPTTPVITLQGVQPSAFLPSVFRPLTFSPLTLSQSSFLCRRLSILRPAIARGCYSQSMDFPIVGLGWPVGKIHGTCPPKPAYFCPLTPSKTLTTRHTSHPASLRGDDVHTAATDHAHRWRTHARRQARPGYVRHTRCHSTGETAGR
jgi:hypothetical protein